MSDVAAAFETQGICPSDNPDAVMPERDGINRSVALGANEKTRAIPIILATGFAEVLTEAVNAGIDDFVAKPFQPDRRIVRVRGLLKVRHLEDEIARAMTYMHALRKAASACGKLPML
jgi:CheY-like chemotaxis protein